MSIHRFTSNRALLHKKHKTTKEISFAVLCFSGYGFGPILLISICFLNSN